MDDAFGMRGLERVCNLDGGIDELCQIEPLPRKPLRERLALEQLHGDEVIALVLFDRVDGADVRMIERRCGARLPLEAFERLRISREFLWKELDRDTPAEPAVF